MKVCAVIAEYNPFHRGHAWQIARAREVTGADFVLVLMSGDFVQRGEPALVDKHTRAMMALAGGADLVLELPCGMATGSAQFFARGAVSLLDALGCVDVLCFGSEWGEITAFFEVAEILVWEPLEYREALQNELRKGRTFPQARNVALERYGALGNGGPAMTAEELNRFLSEPNNILGLEYVQALLLCRSRIQAVTIRREGSGYHEAGMPDEDGIFPSATAVRSLIREKESLSLLSGGIPGEALPILLESLRKNGPVFEDDFSLLLAVRLLEETPESLSSYFDLSPELANRIWKHRNECQSYRQFAALLKTRELTYSRISRALLHLLLHLQAPPAPSYERILGFRRGSGELLSTLSRTCSLPVVTKPAAAERLLTGDALEAFRADVYASNLYGTVRAQKAHTAFLHEYRKSPVILP